MRFSTNGFFHESVTLGPGPLSILLGSFQIFTKIRTDIGKQRLIIGVSDISNK